jgi:transcriptional regulator with PAS, ATPase and Fis domain
MIFTKKTIMVRDEFYERLRRDAFFQRREIKGVLDEILAAWIAQHPEEPHRPVAGNLSESKATLEIEEIKNAMDNARNHRERAAAALGITRMSLNVKCRKYSLTFPPYRASRNKI